MTALDRMPADKFRADVHTIGMPLTEIANIAYTDPRQRQLFKNIIYVGALSVLLDVDLDVFDKLFAEQYKGRGKERLLESNVQALHLGRDYVKQHIQAPLGIRVQRADKVGDQIFTDGNSACRVGYGVWRSNRGGVVSHHTVIVDSRGISKVLRQVSCGC